MKLPTAVATALLAFVANCSHAQSADEWRFHAVLYGYFPDLSGSTSFPVGGGASINVDADTIISNLKFTFMGLLEARRGRWSGFVDFLYIDVGGSQSKTRDASIGGGELPIGVTADLNLNVEGTIVTIAAAYTAVSDPAASLDVVAGARGLSLKQTLGWQFGADLPSSTLPTRSGNSEVKGNNWDGIVGVKGQLSFGANREWFLPYYVDVGTGESDLTWQAIGGIGYAFKWGQVIAAWRYLDYKFKSASALESLTFNGPAIGVGFNW